MSILASKTERKAILQLAKSLKYFEQLHSVKMSTQDTFDARSAENLIRGVIETNGYTVHYKAGKGTRIVKERKHDPY